MGFGEKINPPWRKLSLLVGRGFDFLVRIISSKIFLVFTFIWFVAQAVYMALSTRLGIGPDEAFHYGLIQLFAKNGWLPFIHHQQGFYYLGGVKHSPYFLYQYLLSLPYHLFASSSDAYIYLRFISIAFAIGSLLLINKLAKQLRVSNLVKNLSLFMLANTLMFVFLSASISYDNLVILLTMASFSLLLKLLKDFRAFDFLLLIFLLGCGSLIVVNFLPIDAGILIILLVKYFKELKKTVAKFKSSWPDKKILNIILVFLIIVLAGLFIQRYVYNEFKYHHAQPNCLQTNTLSQCKQNDEFLRDQKLGAIKTRYSMDPLTYIEQWFFIMRDWTFGILGQKHIYPTKFIRLWSELLLVLAGITIIRLYKFKNNRFNPLVAIGIFYTGILIFTNYNGYRDTGLIQFAVQGRYWFLILPIAYIMINHYIIQFSKRAWLAFAYTVLTLLIFSTASLPSYILRTNKSWRTPVATSLKTTPTKSLGIVYRQLF